MRHETRLELVGKLVCIDEIPQPHILCGGELEGKINTSSSDDRTGPGICGANTWRTIGYAFVVTTWLKHNRKYIMRHETRPELAGSVVCGDGKPEGPHPP